MKVLWMGFLGNNMSWSIVGQNVCRQLIAKGHQVDMFSTNGIRFFPDDLKNSLIGYCEERSSVIEGKTPTAEYDMQLSYTAMKNFPLYLSHGSKNRFGIYVYEFSGKNSLPDGFAKYYKSTDKILAPSTYGKDIFVSSGIPENHIEIIPHGIDFKQVEEAQPYALKTKKKHKILVLLAQIHKRKNLSGMLEMYGRAFTNKDDVCLVLKIQDKPITQPFEVSFASVFQTFKSKFKNHGEIEIIREFVPNIYSLYKSCDIVFSASHCEGFGMTALDAHALGKINVVSNHGGFLDFVNKDNGLLIEGKEFIVPPNFLYYSQKTTTKAFMPDINSGVEQLKYSVENKDTLLKKYQSNIPYVKANFSWENIADQIIRISK